MLTKKIFTYGCQPLDYPLVSNQMVAKCKLAQNIQI
jgi:hypothetical protein